MVINARVCQVIDGLFFCSGEGDLDLDNACVRSVDVTKIVPMSDGRRWWSQLRLLEGAPVSWGDEYHAQICDLNRLRFGRLSADDEQEARERVHRRCMDARWDLTQIEDAIFEAMRTS